MKDVGLGRGSVTLREKAKERTQWAKISWKSPLSGLRAAGDESSMRRRASFPDGGWNRAACRTDQGKTYLEEMTGN